VTRAEITERTERIVLQLSRGIEPKRVAMQYGVTYQAVWWLGRQHGVKRRTEIKQERARSWLRKHSGGLSWAEIARREGVPATTVRSAVERERDRER
jgi:hypothetical protein